MLCGQLSRTGPWSKYTDRGSTCADRRSQPSTTLRRSRNVQGARNDTATISSYDGRSRCQPIPAPGANSVTMSCSNASAGTPLIWLATSVSGQKVIGNARIGARLLACEDIPVPEGVYAAIALMAVKFERLQGQLFKSLNEALFVGGRYYIRDIAETGRQLRLPEQVVHAADGTAGIFR